MGRTLRRVTATVVSTAVVLSFAGAAHAAPLTDQQRARLGVAYLRSQQRTNGSIVAFSAVGSTADAVLAFAAAGVGRTSMDRAIGYLRRQVEANKVDTIGLRAKVVMALDAAGMNPTMFGGVNLMHALRSSVGTDGHYGTSAVFDDALVMLAIEYGGASVPLSAVNWLLMAQCPDGGWAYDKPYNAMTDDSHCSDGSGDFFPSDSNTTSYVVQAITNRIAVSWVHDPFAFFSHLRDKVHGGWPYSTGLGTDANSTALVIQAYRITHTPLPKGSVQALRDLQYTACGAFAFNWTKGVRSGADVGATIGAVPGLQPIPFLKDVTVKVGGVPAVPKCA